MKSLAVIIPSRTASNLVPCIAAVRQHEPDARIIVVDDGVDWMQFESTASTAGPNLILPGRKPFVFSRNVNIGIRAAGDADVVLLNDDALLESPGGFSLMQRAAEEHPEYGIIGATTNLTGQPLQQRQSSASPTYGLREVEHIAFVCCLIPHSVREKLADIADYVTDDAVETDHRFTGGFLDERYTAYGSEDLDLCMQVKAIGLKVGVLDTCYVDHSKLHSSYRGKPTAAGNIWVNHRLLRKKWGMPPNPRDPGV